MESGVNSGSLRACWAAGGTALGGWLSLREPHLAELAGGLGFHYVCVDMQHGLNDIRDVAAHLQGLAPGPATPLVRVPWNEPGVIGRVLDLGAVGVIVPMVNSRADAEAAVAACRYAPGGRRSYGPIAAGLRYGADYFAAANDTVLCIPMIETVEALDHLDEILSVPGIDAVYVGPADLSITLGLPPAQEHEDARFQRALAAVVEACARHGVVPGVHASAALAAHRHRQGFRMITVTTDLVAAQTGLRADHAAARAAVSDPPVTP